MMEPWTARKYLILADALDVFLAASCMPRGCVVLVEHDHVVCRYCGEPFLCNMVDLQHETARRIMRHAVWERQKRGIHS